MSLLVAPACASDADPPEVGSGPTTTVPAGDAPSCPSGVGVAAQDAVQAVQCLYRAWREESRELAAVYASLDVLDGLFRERWSPPEGTFTGCEPLAVPGGAAEVCAYRHHASVYRFEVRRSEGGVRVTRLSRH